MLRYLEIKKQLQDIIAATSPGEKLQDRVTLCRMLDTTRTTLDKAIRELVTEGMLTSRRGSGTFVGNNLKVEDAQEISWCVIVPNITESIYNTLVSAIESVAQQKNINVILCSSDNDFQRQERFIRRLSKSGVAGFIIVPVITDDPSENHRLYNNLVVSEIPFIFCNRPVEGISAPTVTSNDFYGGYIATKHLIAQGYHKIAYISTKRYVNAIDRCKGYMSALLENGLEINRRLIRMPWGNGATLNYYDETKRLLETEDVDAVFCFSDTGAVHVGAAITDAGLTISDDIGLICYNDTEVARFYSPSLTSISYKTQEIGKKAAEVLYQRCTNPKGLQEFNFYLFLPEVVERESCKGPVHR